MIPLRDELPSRRFPFLTVTLIATNVLVFLHQFTLGPRAGERFVFLYGAVPALITGAGHAQVALPAPLTLLTSMFLHGGWGHLLGNMLYLWIFGDNVEDVMGPVRFILFYLLAGVAAAMTHVALNPASDIPMVGASGAISGVLGAYLLLFPGSRILTLVPLGFILQTIRVPALLFLGFWFLLQFFSGTASSGGSGGGVAWFAHVGGFASGLALVIPFRQRDRLEWYRRRRGTWG
jgi:membrane associated rhomboid family serine protease